MKKFLSEFLICPACLPKEVSLKLNIHEEEDNDVIFGVLSCHRCESIFRIEEGVAILTPNFQWQPDSSNKYENPKVLSSYLWSHYGDFLGDKEWFSAYPDWVELMKKSNGPSLDIGCAVGRFTFEMAGKSDFSMGFDLSLAFVKTARELMKKRKLFFEITEEGEITSLVNINLPENMKLDNVDFIVADALNIPFPHGVFTKVSSLNIIDKVSNPIKHLKEMNRVSSQKSAQLLISDPFSWSEEVAPVKEWIGGKRDGEFSGFGHENLEKILMGYRQIINPPWKITKKGVVNWKIRNHRNHFELIKSLYVKSERQ